MAGIAIPIVPDKVEAWKSWMHEVVHDRKNEFDEFNRRMGLTAHRAWLMQSPDGPVAVVLHDGPGADDFLQKLAVSTQPFDTWFRDRISEFHGMDFSTPPSGPPPELMVDWKAE